MKRLKRILRVIKNLIKISLYEAYQRDPKNLFTGQDIINLPDKCLDCYSEYKISASGSCEYCHLHGYKELGNNAEEIREYPDERRY